MLLLSMGGVTLAASTASANHGEAHGPAVHKVFVCKYVQKPGPGEVIQPSDNNPISVDTHSLLDEGFTAVYPSTSQFPFEFSDGQGLSMAIAWDPRQGDGQANEPGLNCPPLVGDGVQITPSVQFTEATCPAPNAAGVTYGSPDKVTYTVTSGTIGEGNTVTITATPKSGFVFPSGTQTQWTHTFVDYESLDCANPQVDVSVSPTSVCVGQQVVFTLKNTGSDSTTYVGEFTAPGGATTSIGAVTLAGGASQTFTYTANTAGSYTVKFSVQGNTAVSDTATATAAVCPDLPERPDAVVDRDVEVRESCPGGVERRTVTVTTEYVWDGTAWVLGTPSAPVVSDWVKVRNLTAAEREELNCDEVLPTEGVDLCPNLEGVQESVPPGRSIDEDGNCVRGEVKGTETASPTPGVTPVGNPPLPPQGLPTAVDAGFGGPTDTGSGSMTAVMAQLMMGAGLLFLIAAGWLQRGRQTRGVHQF